MRKHTNKKTAKECEYKNFEGMGTNTKRIRDGKANIRVIGMIKIRGIARKNSHCFKKEAWVEGCNNKGVDCKSDLLRIEA
jgi:hypothetical protein